MTPSLTPLPFAWPHLGSDQPARRDLGLRQIVLDGTAIAVDVADLRTTPFLGWLALERSDARPSRDALVVAPLSGHFALLLRDVVAGLLPTHRVLVSDWMNARHVSALHGPFGLAENISAIAEMIAALRPDGLVLGVCQGAYVALAATALYAARRAGPEPATLALVAAPIDPRANPSNISRLICAQSIATLAATVISPVPEGYAGAGRPVYPAELQLGGLWAYLMRRAARGGELTAKLTDDDGADPQRFPFLDLYASVMDLHADAFLQSLASIYHARALCQGTLIVDGAAIDLRAIQTTSVLTIEGERDDVVPPGQGAAAHRLLAHLPAARHAGLVVPDCGHFGLFHGRSWRGTILPELLAFHDRQG